MLVGRRHYTKLNGVKVNEILSFIEELRKRISDDLALTDISGYDMMLVEDGITQVFSKFRNELENLR